MDRRKLITAATGCLFLLSLIFTVPHILSGTASDRKGFNMYERVAETPCALTKEELVISPELSDGLYTYELYSVEYVPDTLTERCIELISVTDYGFTSEKPKAPMYKSVVYHDEISGEDIYTELALSSVDLKLMSDTSSCIHASDSVAEAASVDNELDRDVEEKLSSTAPDERRELIERAYGWRFREDLSIDLYCEVGGEYLAFRDIFIPYDEKAPVYKSYESAILSSLKLDVSSCRITGSYWLDKGTLNDSGMLVRRGRYTGERLCANYTAIYTGICALPDTEGVKAICVYRYYEPADRRILIIPGGLLVIFSLSLIKTIKKQRRTQ